MTGLAGNGLDERVSRLEADVAALRAEAAVYRGALIWLMGFHQLSHEDQNPRHAVLDPLGLSLDYTRAVPGGPASNDPRLISTARDFVEAAHRVFLSRQTPA